MVGWNWFQIFMQTAGLNSTALHAAMKLTLSACARPRLFLNPRQDHCHFTYERIRGKHGGPKGLICNFIFVKDPFGLDSCPFCILLVCAYIWTYYSCIFSLNFNIVARTIIKKSGRPYHVLPPSQKNATLAYREVKQFKIWPNLYEKLLTFISSDRFTIKIYYIINLIILVL